MKARLLSTTGIALAAFAASAWASVTNLYVANTSLGTGNGSSAANAQSAAWFNAAANWGTDAGQIGAGSTVHLCGTISTDLVVQGSGAAGRPTTIFFEPNARISEPVCNRAINMSGRSYVTIDGGSNGIIENTDNSTAGQHLYSYGIYAEGEGHDCEIKHLTIENIYIHTGSGHEVDQTMVRAISFSGSNWLIHDNVIHDCGWAVFDAYRAGDTNVYVYANNIYHIDHGFILATSSGSAGSFYFYKNHVHDFANWDAGNNAYHHDGIHAFAAYGPAHVEGFWIYNNLFDGDIGISVTGYIFLEGGSGKGRTPWSDDTSTAYIFNNVFSCGANNRSANGVVQVYIGTKHVICNNTIMNGAPGSGIALAVGGESTQVKINNNFMSGANTLLSLNATCANVTSDLNHNVYANCTSFNAWWWGSTDTSNFAIWKKGSGADADSLATLSTMGGIDGATGKPTPGSAVIGAGVNLTSLGIAALNSDINGVPRPKTGPWDVGAYVFVPAAP